MGSFCHFRSIDLQLNLEGGNSINARNAVWILVFCPHLVKANLGFAVSLQDYRFLTEYSCNFKRLSNVKESSIKFGLIHDELRQRKFWGLPGEESKTWMSGSKKITAIGSLLQVTKKLVYLEISEGDTHDTQDQSEFHTGSLCYLTETFNHLRHLRGMGIGSNHKYGIDLTIFKNLRVLSVELSTLFELFQWKVIHLPSSIEVISLEFYTPFAVPLEEFKEEVMIASALNSKTFANLKQITVPKNPVSVAGEIIDAP